MYNHVSNVEENMKHGWGNLGVKDTIFEAEDEDIQSISSHPSSFPLSSPSSPLQSCVDAWTTSTGRKPDVKIYVHGICFNLHKDPLMSKSSYLKRRLITVSEFTLSPPLKVTADTFKLVADFSYSGHVVVTPFNVANLRIAAELLEIHQGDDNDESLREVTESYLCNVLFANKGFTSNVFRSCLALLPEAEQAACLVSRCLETLFGSCDNGDNEGAVSCADGLKGIAPQEFKVVAESMQRRYTRSHDLLYKVIDIYFLVYNGKISEDQKTQICSCIDCSILSPPLLMHAVQNPRMPLRFVVQAMLIEQLNTHRSIFSALSSTTNNAAPIRPQSQQDNLSESPATLGAILERDAALRQVAHLRATINSTCSRIQTLEKELCGMKKLLGEQEKETHKSLLLLEGNNDRNSYSCRFANGNNLNNKIERGERGSVSSSMIRFGENRKLESSASCLQNDHQQSPRAVKRNFGQRLIRSLKNAFGGSNKIKDGKLEGQSEKMIGFENEEIIPEDSFSSVMQPLPHHRSRSIF